MNLNIKNVIRFLGWMAVFFMGFMPIVFAGMHGENNPELLAYMRENPDNYVRYAGQSTGITLYIEKDSIHVDQYEPPKYIIGFKTVYYASNGMLGEHHREMARYKGEVRYLYDLDSRKMYIERNDENGNTAWEYVDETQYRTLEAYRNGKQAVIAAGAVAFYLTYKISFYENNSDIEKLLRNTIES